MKIVKKCNSIMNKSQANNVSEAFKIANNAIYFNDRSDYLSALYDVCRTLKPNEDVEKIGIKYLE